MAKINFCTRIAIVVACSFLLTSCSFHLNGQDQITISEKGDSIDMSDPNEPEVISTTPTEETNLDNYNLRKRIAKIYTKEIGVRERTGRNDGKDVEKYLASVGLGPGYAWCAAFVHWCFKQAGVFTKINAWSPTAENKTSIRYKTGKMYDGGPKQADVITLYYEKKGRIGHTGFFDHMTNASMVASVEGNTDRSNSNEGDGVYLVFRPLKTIHSISSWID